MKPSDAAGRVCAVPVKIDGKGRLTVPRGIRDALGIEAGDVFFLERRDGVLCFAKVQNPFDGLAAEAVRAYRAGETRSLRDIAREDGAVTGSLK